MKIKSTRQLKVEQLIKKLISEIFLREGILSVSNVIVTITEVDVSPDIKNAKIYLDIFGKVDAKRLVAELNSNSAYFRHKLTGKMVARSSPEIKFILDETAIKAQKMDELIDQEGKNFK